MCEDCWAVNSFILMLIECEPWRPFIKMSTCCTEMLSNISPVCRKLSKQYWYEISVALVNLQTLFDIQMKMKMSLLLKGKFSNKLLLAN